LRSGGRTRRAEKLGLRSRYETCCRRVKTVVSIIVRVDVRVCVFGVSGGLKNTRITERTQ
jgi:hypothetical protein